VNILLTNHGLLGPGGTEKWTYYTARELSRIGHDVEVFTFRDGLAGTALKEFCKVTTETPTGDYDVIYSNHNTCLSQVQALGPPVIHTCHGPSNRLEVPVLGAWRYVGVSEEVVEGAMDHGIPMRLITNGVDLEEFCPQETPSGPPRVLSMCKSVATSWMLQDACAELGWPYDWVHYTTKPRWEIATLMKEADIIVGCGRTAIEGLACGKEVLVFDGRTDEPMADGWVTEENVELLRRKNFSCRTNEYWWNVPSLTRTLQQYEPGNWSRAWAKENADISLKAQEYMKLYEEFTIGC